MGVRCPISLVFWPRLVLDMVGEQTIPLATNRAVSLSRSHRPFFSLSTTPRPGQGTCSPLESARTWAGASGEAGYSVVRLSLRLHGSPSPTPGLATGLATPRPTLALDAYGSPPRAPIRDAAEVCAGIDAIEFCRLLVAVQDSDGALHGGIV